MSSAIISGISHVFRDRGASGEESIVELIPAWTLSPKHCGLICGVKGHPGPP